MTRRNIREANRLQRPPCPQPGQSLVPFELMGNSYLTPSGSCYAGFRFWDLTTQSYQTQEDDRQWVPVHDTHECHDGVGRGYFSGTIPGEPYHGSYGWATLMSGSGLWEIVNMDATCKMARGIFRGSWEETAGTFYYIDHVESVDPLAWLMHPEWVWWNPANGYSLCALQGFHALGISGGAETEPDGFVYVVRSLSGMIAMGGELIHPWQVINYDRIPPKYGY